MLCYHPSSRQERRSLYLQTLRSSLKPKIIQLAQFKTEQPKLFHQIHVDSKRALWHFFEAEQLGAHLDAMGIPRGKPVNDCAFVRFHQRFLERLTIDVMTNITQGHYFQGLNQILAAYYFVFVRDDLLVAGKAFDDFAATNDTESGDFVSSEDGADTAIENYDIVLAAAVRLCQESLAPLFEPNIEQLSRYVQLAYEPYMRLIDCQLYELINRTESLRDIAPSILMGGIQSHLQYNCNVLSNALRFLDASVHGDWITEVFIATAALSLAVRYRNPSLFPEAKMKLELVGTEQIQGLQTINNDDDNLFRVMGSMEQAEKIIKDFADQAIRFGMCAYYTVVVAQTLRHGQVFEYIATQFDIQRNILAHFKYNHRQELIQQQYCNKVGAEFEKGLRGVDGDTEYFFLLIMNSIRYDREHHVEHVALDVKSIQESLKEFGAKTGIALLKTAEVVGDGLKVAWTGVSHFFRKLGGEIQSALAQREAEPEPQ